MLVRAIKRMIEDGNTEGLAEKLDVFLKANSLTDGEHAELMAMLPDTEN